MFASRYDTDKGTRSILSLAVNLWEKVCFARECLKFSKGDASRYASNDRLDIIRNVGRLVYADDRAVNRGTSSKRNLNGSH